MSMSSRENPISIKEQSGFKEESEKRTSPLAKKTLSDGQEEQPIHRRSVLVVVRYYLPPVIHRPIEEKLAHLSVVWYAWRAIRFAIPTFVG